VKKRVDVDARDLGQSRSLAKNFQMTTHDEKVERVLGMTSNNRLIPQILDEVGNSILKPPNKPDVKETELSVTKSQPGDMKSTQVVPPEVSHWISELKDEIITARMTLQHVLELTSDSQGSNSLRFREFIHMIESSDMLQPFLLPDVCANWLPNATAFQVGVVRELTNILQSVKNSIKNIIEESDCDVVRKRCMTIHESRILNQLLPSFNIDSA